MRNETKTNGGNEMENQELNRWMDKNAGREGAGQARQMIKGYLKGRISIESVMESIENAEAAWAVKKERSKAFFKKRAICKHTETEIISHEELRCKKCGTIFFVADTSR